MALIVKLKTTKPIDNKTKEVDKNINTILHKIGIYTTSWIRTQRMSGNPIKVRTGNLRNSVFYEVNKNDVKIGSRGVIYAKFLEFARKLANYRWLRPAFEHLKNGGLNRILKGS